MPALIATPVGITKTGSLTLKSRQQVTPTFTGQELLSAQVWRGGAQPVLFTATATWSNPTQGQILLTFPGSATQGLEPGTYPVLVLVNGNPVVDGNGEPIVNLVLGDAPGTEAALTSYCTVKDMRDYFHDIATQLREQDETGFARARQKARWWTDRVIQANRRNNNNSIQYGLAGGVVYGGSWFGWNQAQPTDPILQGYLDANKLMMTNQVIEMNARMSIAYACEGQIGPTEDLSAWQKIASNNRLQAEAIAMKLVAGIDLNNDGYAEITIDCGKASNR